MIPIHFRNVATIFLLSCSIIFHQCESAEKETALPTDEELMLPQPPESPSAIEDENPDEPVECSSDEDEMLTGRGLRLLDRNFRWKNLFSVFIDPAFNKENRAKIEAALFRIQKEYLPCLPIKIWRPNTTPRGDYVYIKAGLDRRCNSQVGRQGGEQILRLAVPGCMRPSIITHELMHALGLHHEQTRHDRDDYVEIKWENIKEHREHNFKKIGADISGTFGVPYNHRSIMHYGAKFFSDNGQPTIVLKNGRGDEKMGSTQMQPTDIQKIRRMYNCTE